MIKLCIFVEIMLYPIKFIPIFKEKIWGGTKLKSVLNKKLQSNKVGETWEVSGFKNNLSVVLNGHLSGRNINEILEVYKQDLVGKKIYESFGNFFPLLIKFIDASEDLSVQVHPDDDFAMEKHNENGKNEMWFVVDADADAEIIVGVKKSLSKNEYLKYTEEKKLRNVLNFVKVKKGDAIFIPAGRIHAIMKGVLLAEIQQNSDLTYRIYDWDRKDDYGKSRELHTEFASEVVELEKQSDYLIDYNYKNEFSELESNKYFTTNFIRFSNNLKKDYSLKDSFVILMCIAGSFNVKYREGYVSVQKGETVLIPASLKKLELIPKAETELLEVYI